MNEGEQSPSQDVCTHFTTDSVPRLQLLCDMRHESESSSSVIPQVSN